MSSINISGNRTVGLMSGLDTESIVKSMLQRTQSKINKQYQARMTLSYKQDAYREVISKMTSFSDKYLTMASKTNIMSKNFFSSNTFKSSNDAISVSGDAAAIKDFQINSVKQVADYAKAVTGAASDQTFSSGEIVTSKDVSVLAGQSISFNYGGNYSTITLEEKDVKATDTLSDVVKTLNDKIAADDNLKDKVKFDIEGDKVKISNIGPGDMRITAVGTEIENNLKVKVSPTEGGTVGAGNSVVADDAAVTSFSKTETLADALKNGSISFEYNSVRKTLKFSDEEIARITDSASFASELQKKLDSSFGSNKVSVTNDGGKLSFTATDNSTDNSTNLFGITSVDSKIASLTGLKSGSYNRLDKSVEISTLGLTANANGKYEMEVNGKTFEFEGTSSINDVINTINNDGEVGVKISHSSTTDKFTITSKETGAQAKVEIKGELASKIFGQEIAETRGQDAELNIEGIGNISRSSNTFTIDGVNVNLTSAAAGIKEKVTFSVDNNVDEVAKNLKQFIDDYNDLVTYMDEQVTTGHDRNYAPLTEDQRNEMTESEIKLWDEKAKQGMLFSDQNVTSALNDLRSAMSGFVKGAGKMLYEIGIDIPTGDYSGKLSFDEEKFKEAYADNPEAVQKLFTQEVEGGSFYDQGIANRLKSTVEKNIGLRGEKGILAEYAGAKSTTTEKNNYITTRMKEYQDVIDELKTKMETERQRYWNQFTALETALAKMNNQMSMFMGQ